MLSFGLFSASPVRADKLTICGLEFDVDKLNPVDDANDKVVMFGQSWLVPKAKLEAFVVGKYFERREGIVHFGFEPLADCVASSITAKQDELAYRSLAALLSYPSQAGQSVPAFLDTGPFEPRVLEVFQRALLIAGPQVSQPVLAARLLFHLGMQDSAWIRKNVSPLIFNFANPLKQFGDNRFNAALKAGNVARATQVLKFLNELFGANDETVRGLMTRQSKINEILTGLSKPDATEWQPYLEKLRGDPVLAELIAPQISEKLLEEAQRAGEKGEHERALMILAMIDPAKHGEGSFAIVSAALAGLDEKGSAALAHPEVAALVSAAADVNEEVRKRLVDRVEKELHALLAYNKVAESEAFFGKLLELRPDPNPINDDIRIEQARAYLSLGQEASAKDKIRNVHFGFSVSRWGRLLFFWMRAYPLFVAVMALIPIVGAALIGFVLFRRAKKEAEPPPVVEEEETIDPLPKFVVSGLKETVNPEYREYVTCLKVFGLKAGADLAAIKNAYRKAVKEYHPDMNKKAEAMASEVFVEMTKTYERLLEIFEEHGGPPPRG